MNIFVALILGKKEKKKASRKWCKNEREKERLAFGPIYANKTSISLRSCHVVLNGCSKMLANFDSL